MEATARKPMIFLYYVALPQEHGAWVFLFSPLLIGLFAGESLSFATVLLIIGCLAAFLVRQPVSVAVKIFSGRRPRRELAAARFWTALYGIIGVTCLAGLIWLGFSYLLFLALPGLPVFVWHLYLVSRRAERRQMGVELIATGVLCLAAPAAYWVGKGQPDSTGWWLFVLSWLQSAASIVYAYLRLEQRSWNAMPELVTRMGMAWRACSYATFNLVFATTMGFADLLPISLIVPYALQWAETLWGSLRPAIGLRPTQIGIRQLIVSSLFTLSFILTWK